MTKNLNELSGTELVTVMNEVMAEVKSRLDEGTVTKYVAREIPSTITVNQQRAETIQRAREFVGEQIDPIHRDYVVKGKNGVEHLCDARFAHDFKKRTTTCTLVGISTGYTRKKTIAHCHPNEVFNEPLGEVVSLCKALKIDIPQEFADAVQPVDKVIGMVVIAEEHKDGEHILIASGETLRNGYAHIGSPVGKDGKIIDDTNAEYQFESVGEPQ